MLINIDIERLDFMAHRRSQGTTRKDPGGLDVASTYNELCVYFHDFNGTTSARLKFTRILMTNVDADFYLYVISPRRPS
jgi:hypothetical protein